MLDRFPFNVDKFLQLSLHSQQTHLSDWLEDCYHKQIQGKFTELELELLFEQYIQFFLGQKNLKKPKTTAEWKEFFSQRFHYHRNKTNQGIKENNFLPSNALRHEKEKGKVFSPRTGWRIVLDNIRSAFNVGSVFRSADGAGWQEVILSGYSPSPENKQVQKAAMRTENWMKWQKVENLKDWLQKQPLPVIALETEENSKNCFDYKWQSEGILIVGNEEYGVSSEILELCQDLVSIPMYGVKKSLNLACAFSVVSYLVPPYRSFSGD